MIAEVAQAEKRNRFDGKCNKWMDEHSDLIVQLALGRKLGKKLDDYIAPILSSVSGLSITASNVSYWRTKKSNAHFGLFKYRRSNSGPRKVKQLELAPEPTPDPPAPPAPVEDVAVLLLRHIAHEINLIHAGYLTLSSRLKAIEESMQVWK